MGIERKIAALASAFLLSVSSGMANAQDPSNKIPLETTPLTQRGFNPYHTESTTRKIPIPKSKKFELISESSFYYFINGSVVIEYVRNGKVVDAFVCSSSSVLSYYQNNDSKKGFENLSPDPNPSCNQNDFVKP